MHLEFSFVSKGTKVHIIRDGQTIVVLRKLKAARFLENIKNLSEKDQQLLLAKVTGNYKRGNEKLAKNHPRNKFR